MLSKLYRIYPVVKDKTDDRDLTLPVPTLTGDQAAQEWVDLRPFCGPVKDQGQAGSCTAHAASEMREFLYRKYNDQEPDKTVPAKEFILSPLYLYYMEREFEGDIDQDGGAQMRTAAKMLNNVGTCLLKDDPYNVGNLYVKPSDVQTKDANTYRSGSYHRLEPGVATMIDVLKSGYTFILGMNVYSSFEDDYTARTGQMLVPNIDKEQCLGGHAVHVVGFDNVRQHLIIMNSWGTDWGQEGYFFMPYCVANNPDVVTDCWVSHLGGKWGTAAQIAQVEAYSSEEATEKG